MEGQQQDQNLAEITDDNEADWQKAMLHMKATSVGKPKTSTDNGENKYCQCCLNPVDIDPIPLTAHTKDLEFLGYGFPLFYDFIKNSILLLIALMASYSIMSTLFGSKETAELCLHTSHDQHHPLFFCQNWMLKVSRITKEIPDTEITLRVTSFVMVLATLMYITSKLYNLNKYYDQRNCTPADYAILVTTSVPHPNFTGFLYDLFSNELEVADLLNPEGPYEIPIEEVLLLPVLDPIEALEKTYEHSIEQKVHYARKLKKNQSQYSKERLEELKEQITRAKGELMKKCSEMIEAFKMDSTPEIQKAIVIVRTGQIRNEILKMASHLPEEVHEKYLGNGGRIRLSSLSEPKEINWHNIDNPLKDRILSIVIGYLLSILLVGVIATIFYFILKKKSQYLEDALSGIGDVQTEHNVAVFLVYFTIFVVILFNKFILALVLHKLVHLEKYMTISGEQFSFTVKYSLAMFFTTAFMTVTVEGLDVGNYFQHQYGVVQEEQIMFIVTTILVPLIWLINPFSIYAWIRQKYYYKKEGLTQEEANHLMEKYPYDMGKRYAEILEIIWFTFFYSSLIPIGCFFSIICLCLYYWIDKWNLLRRVSIQGGISGKLSHHALRILGFALLAKTGGEMIFDLSMRGKWVVSTLICLILSALYMLVNWGQLLHYLEGEKFYAERLPYRQARLQFRHNYSHYHPVYKHTAFSQSSMLLTEKVLAFLKLNRPSNPTRQTSPLKSQKLTPNIDANPSKKQGLESSSNGKNPLELEKNPLTLIESVLNLRPESSSVIMKP